MRIYSNNNKNNLNLTNTASEESNEQFSSGVSNIERDHKKQSLHIPMTRPNVSKNG